LNFKVSAIAREADGFILAAEDGRGVKARYIVNSAGLFSDEIARLLGEEGFSVHPRRGEYMLLDKECGATVNCTIFHTPTRMGKGVLVSPTVHGNLIVGPTAVDMKDKTDTATTADGFAELRVKAADNVANIPYGKVITSFCGLRSVGSTGDFIIKAQDGVVHLGGIESPGLSSSPAIAEHVTDLLGKMGLSLTKKANYNPNRAPTDAFRHMSVEEKNQIIRQDPRYGRMICRCEGVTEGEMVEAIHRNPPAYDVDAVKRRTRGGMGRCQGGFCSPEVIRILAREWGVPYDAITKNGGNSWINRGRTKSAKKEGV
ncbi:MAG: FAD-dependent oxidoreductase, partial [Clostridia bacterium]|nr:FAD-dependent oxidoreductase [Clostridia bacterium]